MKGSGHLVHAPDSMPEKLVTLEFPVVTLENLAPTMRAMNIHRRIRERREALGLSMQALAKLVQVRAWQTVQQWEKEDGGTAPKRERLAAVAVALQTTPEYLLFGDVSAQPPTAAEGDRTHEAPPPPFIPKTKWAGLPDGPAMQAALSDWRQQASPKSQEVIDTLIQRAKNNDFSDEVWELFLWLAEKHSKKNP